MKIENADKAVGWRAEGRMTTPSVTEGFITCGCAAVVASWRTQANRLRSEHERLKRVTKGWPEPSCYQTSADVYDGCADELEQQHILPNDQPSGAARTEQDHEN